MNKTLSWILSALLFSFFVTNTRQFLLCPRRKVIVQEHTLQTMNKCVFCDPDILAQNYIIHEDSIHDVRIMMNKFPYCYFSQAHHLLIMPISHKTSFTEFSSDELGAQLYKALDASALLYSDSYSQEYFINLGEGGGQSVPHLHSHILNFIQPPLSLPDLIKSKISPLNNINDAFALIKSKLSSIDNTIIPVNNFLHLNEECYHCSIVNNEDTDEEKLVVGRFNYNMVCIANFPKITAEVTVIPYRHVHALHHLQPEELLENMQLSLLLLPLLKTYTQEKIRQWKGDNIFIKSIGGKASEEDKNEYHVFTSIMPRTIISSPSGTLDGHSCKLDFDPEDLYNYLKTELGELQSKFLMH